MISLLILFASGVAYSQTQSPAGLWKTLSDKKGEAESLVRIIEVNGEFQGKVETIFSPPAPTSNPVCDQCKGELKDKPIIGMKILTGLRRKGEEFTGGTILDPDEGETYKCTIRLIDGGAKLEVRGYIGISLFGRTQTWLRQD
ncbi:MAG TPA: DUF2147 domain-containing protein [Burkholderiaceae bacterium]|jgi:uncharacterized protein (DUF2147 family)